jgi:hypothetical protein
MGQVFLHTTAAHEAGHAIAACALRIAFERIVLDPAAEPWVCERSGLTVRWAGGYEGRDRVPALQGTAEWRLR